MKAFAYLGVLALAATLTAGSAFAATVENFDGSITLSPTQAPGAWYTDRFAPASFTSGVAYGGHAGTLAVGVAGGDFQGVGSFYNTEGRKLDLGPTATTMSIELYIDQSFTTGDDRRIAGFWGSTFGSADDPAYPIIELDRIGGNLEFRGWDNSGSFFDLGTLGAGDVGAWKTLSITLNGANFDYKAAGFTGSTSAFGTKTIGNVILQAHNTGADYSVHWDNLSANVPEPATWAMMIMGFGLAGAILRRRSAVAA
jgi:hypothetical protein